MSDETHAFQWSGINGQGRRESGVIQSRDLKDAQLELKKMGIEVIDLKIKNSFSGLNILSQKKKVKQKDILLFTRYLSTMLAAGLPMIQALDIIGSEQENPSMKSLIVSLRTNISEGKTLAESFSLYPNYFSELYCNLIKAGEKSGTIDKILIRLGNYLERSESIKRKVKKALTYPIAILAVALIVSLVLLIFVVPQFQAMFQSFGAELPLFTQIVVGLSHSLRSYWWVVLIIVMLCVMGFRHLKRESEQFNLLLDQWVLKIMIIGGVLRNGIIARYTRTLATTLESGMPIIDSMNAMSQIMGNRIYSKAVLQIRDDVVSGHQLSASMASTKLFPNMAIQMIAVGEASGRLSEMLNKVADYYEEEVNTVVDNLSSLLEPLIMLILGVVVGSFVVAMYLPIFKIGSLM